MFFRFMRWVMECYVIIDIFCIIERYLRIKYCDSYDLQCILLIDINGFCNKKDVF